LPNPSAPRLAILSFSNGRFDARARRIARSAAAAGYEPVVYARWQWGLPLREEVDGLQMVRVPMVLDMAIPGLRWRGRRKVARILAATGPAVGEPATLTGPAPRAARAKLRGAIADPRRALRSAWRRFRRAVSGSVLAPVAHAITWPLRGLIGPFVLFPLRPLAWAEALEQMAEPADIWHGMWAGSLPALIRLRGRDGGRAVYDSRDVYLHARVFDRMRRPLRAIFVRLERRWARAADLVVTVNDAYADILVPLLGIARPIVVRNCPDPYDPPGAPPDRIRALAGIPPTTPVVLYQGGFLTDRGIEQGMEAILLVPGARLVLMGYGSHRDAIAAMATQAPYADRVTMIDPVPPEVLLEWTASADIMLMAIQPTSLNHRFTTPQKLWEAIAAGVPVVASDQPGKAEVVREVGCGALCDPTDPASIATAIRELLAMPAAARAEMRARTLAAARDRYNWAAQADTLLAAYGRLQAVS
jgi:glycosyltransferase involved in cell wall biosynthesis